MVQKPRRHHEIEQALNQGKLIKIYDLSKKCEFELQVLSTTDGEKSMMDEVKRRPFGDARER